MMCVYIIITVKTLFIFQDKIQWMNKRVVKYHKELLGEEFPLFEEWVRKAPRRSIRVNPIRTSVNGFKEELEAMNAEQMPWLDYGFWVEGGSLGATIPHQMGYYYIQEAASMLPPIVLGAQKGDIILDLAAAPGSKSTQIAPDCNTIVSNDPDYTRRKALVANLERCGVMNAIVSHFDGTRFPQRYQFDKILVDAPCSNMGSARKSPGVLKTWSQGFARNISGLQKGLIYQAFSLLKPGGTLAYSTCTTSTEENEDVILRLLEKFPEAKLEKAEANIKSRPGLLPGTEKCMRIYPWDNDTEFFFVAKISKNG
jgi:NOL1/NOP2/sun family putative RNA methylase